MSQVRYRTTGGHTVTVYPVGGYWSWEVRSGNGTRLAEATLAYGRKDAALRAARRLHPEQEAQPA